MVDIIEDAMTAPAQETQELNRYREDEDEEDGDDLRIAAIQGGEDDDTCSITLTILNRKFTC
jgi:hypothetical protein